MCDAASRVLVFLMRLRRPENLLRSGVTSESESPPLHTRCAFFCLNVTGILFSLQDGFVISHQLRLYSRMFSALLTSIGSPDHLGIINGAWTEQKCVTKSCQLNVVSCNVFTFIQYFCKFIILTRRQPSNIFCLIQRGLNHW